MSSTSKNSGAVTWATLPHSTWRVPMSSVLSSSLPRLIDRISPTTRVPFWRTTRRPSARRGGRAARTASSETRPATLRRECVPDQAVAHAASPEDRTDPPPARVPTGVEPGRACSRNLATSRAAEAPPERGRDDGEPLRAAAAPRGSALEPEDDPAGQLVLVRVLRVRDRVAAPVGVAPVALGVRLDVGRASSGPRDGCRSSGSGTASAPAAQVVENCGLATEVPGAAGGLGGRRTASRPARPGCTGRTEASESPKL